MLEGHLCSQCDDREKCRKEHEKLTKDVTIEKMCMNEVQITELIYQLSEEYIGTNCDENSNDIQYNAGFQDGIEGFRNYVRRELMNNRRK